MFLNQLLFQLVGDVIYKLYDFKIDSASMTVQDVVPFTPPSPSQESEVRERPNSRLKITEDS